MLGAPSGVPQRGASRSTPITSTSWTIYEGSRRAELRFTGGAGSQQSGPAPLWRRMRHPPSGLGPGLRSRFSTDAPLLIHALPKRLRFEFVRRHLGPAASKMMKDKVVGRVPLLLGRELLAAAVEDSRVALTLSRKDGPHEVLRV